MWGAQRNEQPNEHFLKAFIVFFGNERFSVSEHFLVYLEEKFRNILYNLYINGTVLGLKSIKLDLLE